MSELEACPMCNSKNISRPITSNGYWWCEDCKNPFIPGINGWVSIRTIDLELNYVSKISFNLIRSENESLRSRIAKLESQQRWIPVSEPLKKDEFVIGNILFYNGENLIDVDMRYLDGRFCHWNGTRWIEEPNCTHYKLYPTPPTE